MMVKLRTGTPWMPAAEYARTLKGLTVNLLVAEIDRCLPFHREVLGADLVYSDPDFAVLRGFGSEWMLHADHTYADHALLRHAVNVSPRGAGMELRLHGRNPDEAEKAARRLGATVLVPSTDKGHGVREVFLVDTDGYVWVPDVALPPKPG